MTQRINVRLKKLEECLIDKTQQIKQSWIQLCIISKRASIHKLTDNHYVYIYQELIAINNREKSNRYSDITF